MRFALATIISLLSAPAIAGDIAISDAYARFLPGAMSGAAYFVIENSGDTDDRLVGVASDAAERVELHSHMMTADGVAQMAPIEGGIALPAHSVHALESGGDHVMLMGLSGPVGDSVTLTLTFEAAGDVSVEVPVDNTR